MDAGYCVFETAIGACGIAWRDGVIAGVQLPEGDQTRTRARMQRRFPAAAEAPPPPEVATVVERLRRSLEGAPDPMLDVPLDLGGVGAFQQRVYQVTRAIAPGRTLTYGEVAAAIGEPGSARAVGQALGHNPFAPIVPCHRVLAARSRAGGFSAEGGVVTKLRLLELEQARFGTEPGLFD